MGLLTPGERSCPRHPDFIPLGLKALRAFARLFYSSAIATTYDTNYISEVREQAQRSRVLVTFIARCLQITVRVVWSCLVTISCDRVPTSDVLAERCPLFPLDPPAMYYCILEGDNVSLWTHCLTFLGSRLPLSMG